MKFKKTELSLEGKVVTATVQVYEKSDLEKLKDYYWQWVNLSNSLQDFGGRRINLPEIISESIFCIHFNSVRLNESISGVNTSFDCYQLDTKKRIQIKACSIEEDLTSFGPKSVWDELYFVHFFPNHKYDGCFAIYLIKNNLIYDHRVSKTQTFREQQAQGRRPRFSIIKDIIIPNKIEPIFRSSF